MYTIISYDIVNGTRTQSRDKDKPALSLDYINELQRRAERLWNHRSKEPLTVYVNYKVPVEQHVRHQ